MAPSPAAPAISARSTSCRRRTWTSSTAALPKAWYLPSHSLVYADVDGNIAYFGVALTPQRKNWDGLMPVPGKDGKYEWDGFVPFEQLPFSKNDPRGFYNSSNNDVVPKIVPGYKIPLGYEYSAPYRYERVFEVLSRARPVRTRRHGAAAAGRDVAAGARAGAAAASAAPGSPAQHCTTNAGPVVAGTTRRWRA